MTTKKVLNLSQTDIITLVRGLAEAIDESVGEEVRPLYDVNRAEAEKVLGVWDTLSGMDKLRAALYADVRTVVEVAVDDDDGEAQPKPVRKKSAGPAPVGTEQAPAPRKRRKAVKLQDEAVDWKPGMDPAVLIPSVKPSPQLIRASMRVLQEHLEYLNTDPIDDFVKDTKHHPPKRIKKAEMVIMKAMQYDMDLDCRALYSIREQKGDRLGDKYAMDYDCHVRVATEYGKGYVRYILKNEKIPESSFMVIDNGILQPFMAMSDVQAVKFKHIELPLDRNDYAPKAKPIPKHTGTGMWIDNDSAVKGAVDHISRIANRDVVGSMATYPNFEEQMKQMKRMKQVLPRHAEYFQDPAPAYDLSIDYDGTIHQMSPDGTRTGRLFGEEGQSQ